MSRSSNVPVKPMLEKLEDRALPSFLLSGNVVSQLATPLNNMVADMKSASTDLQAQFALIQNKTAPANTFAGAELVADKAVADWQRIVTDSSAITALSKNYQAVISSIALAEFQAGDSLDLIILNFGSVFGLHPLDPLTTPVAQANKIVNDPTLQGIVNSNLHTLNTFVDSTTPISQVTVTPTF